MFLLFGAKRSGCKVTGWLEGENMKDRASLPKTGERNIQILGQFSLFFEPICHITDPHFTEVV